MTHRTTETKQALRLAATGPALDAELAAAVARLTPDERALLLALARQMGGGGEEKAQPERRLRLVG